MRKVVVSGVAAFILGFLLAESRAGIVQSNFIDNTSQVGFSCYGNDLINSGQATLASNTPTSGMTWGDPIALINSSMGVSGSLGTSGVGMQNASWTATFYLNTSVNTNGYTLTELSSYAGWASGRISQGYELKLAFQGDAVPGTFYSYGVFSLTAGTPANGSSKLQLTDSSGIIAEHVNAIRLVFTYFTGNETIYREVDALGYPTSSGGGGPPDATIYVATNGTHTSPFDTWAKAATNINAAFGLYVNATILVSNGIYAVTNEIPISDGTVVRGVTGSSNTVLRRSGSGRIFNMTAAGTVDGFTLCNANNSAIYMTAGSVLNCLFTNNTGGTYGAINMTGGTVSNCVFTKNSATADGGAIHMAGGGSELIVNCIITNNSVSRWGGGVEFETTSAGATLRNCLIARNSAAQGGGGISFYNAVGNIENCTIVSNTAPADYTGGGILEQVGGSARLTNTIVYHNVAPVSPDLSVLGGSMSAGYSCSPAWGILGGNGVENTTYEPLFKDFANGNYRLMPDSPCVDRGTNLAAVANDLDGNARPFDGDYNGVARHDMGAYEMTNAAAYSCDFVGSPQVGTNSLQVVFTASVFGATADTNILWYGWDFTNTGTYGQSGPGLRVVTNLYTQPGLYAVRLAVSNDQNVVTSRVRTAFVRIYSGGGVAYVATNGLQQWPYDTLEKAATDIQTAIDVAPNLLVLVSNGTYAVSTAILPNNGTVVRSVNGASNTIVKRTGGSIRVFDISLYGGATVTNCTIDGLTIRDGNTASGGGGLNMVGGTIQNCLFISNSGSYGAIHMTGGTVSNCIFTGNSAVGGDGGGIHAAGGPCRILYCIFTNNTAGRWGGGVEFENALAGSLLQNCLVARNTSSKQGGGVSCFGSSAVRIENCTIVSNTSAGSDGAYPPAGGGGLYCNSASVSITNSIICSNAATSANDYSGSPLAGYSCTPVWDGGNAGLRGNITYSPEFVNFAGGDYRLGAISPCIDAGTNIAVSMDLDGNARPYDGDFNGQAITDIGAYERVASVAYSCDFTAAPAVGTNSLQVVFTASVLGLPLDTNIVWYGWDFTNTGSFQMSGPGLAVVTNYYPEPGLYGVRLVVSNDQQVATNRTRTGVVRVYSDSGVVYVSTNGTDSWPYETWAKAARSIQSAIDVASNTLVRVSNGTYTVTSEIIPQNGTVLRSETGASNTVIRRSSGTLRIFNIGQYLSLPIGRAVVDGFTIRDGNGSSGNTGGAIDMSVGTILNCIFRSNGAVYGAIHITGSGLISNCVFSGNTASADGGGVHIATGASGLILNCVFTNNSVNRWGGAVEFENCLSGTTIRNCLIARNSAGDKAGGISAYLYSGGSVYIENCTVVSNSAVNAGGGVCVTATGGGSLKMTNSIVYFNRAASSNNLYGTMNVGYSCAPDLTDGVNGNRTADPQLMSLADGNYRLAAGSPCLDSGLYQPWMDRAVTLDGELRIKRGSVDMGAYEMSPAQGILFIFK